MTPPFHALFTHLFTQACVKSLSSKWAFHAITLFTLKEREKTVLKGTNHEVKPFESYVMLSNNPIHVIFKNLLRDCVVSVKRVGGR